MAMCGESEVPMQSMNISLPDPLKQFVDGQVSQGRYSSASEYVRELIRADRIFLTVNRRSDYTTPTIF